MKRKPPPPRGIAQGSITQPLRVEDCMTRPVTTIHSDALVKGAAQLMRTRRIRHLPVVDRGDRLVGIVTDRDLRQVIFDPSIRARLGSSAAALNELTVREIMTWGVVTVRPKTDIREAAGLMHEQKIGAVPVVDGETVVGILTEHDVLDAFRGMLGKRSARLHDPPVLGPRARPTRVRPLAGASPPRHADDGAQSLEEFWLNEGEVD